MKDRGLGSPLWVCGPGPPATVICPASQDSRKLLSISPLRGVHESTAVSCCLGCGYKWDDLASLIYCFFFLTFYTHLSVCSSLCTLIFPGSLLGHLCLETPSCSPKAA